MPHPLIVHPQISKSKLQFKRKCLQVQMSNFSFKSSQVSDDKVIYFYCCIYDAFPASDIYVDIQSSDVLTPKEECQNEEPEKDPKEECQSQEFLLASELSAAP